MTNPIIYTTNKMLYAIVHTLYIAGILISGKQKTNTVYK
jgi:hypothetical protein